MTTEKRAESDKEGEEAEPERLREKRNAAMKDRVEVRKL